MDVLSAVSLPNKLVASTGSATAMLSPVLGIRFEVAEISEELCDVAVLSAVAFPNILVASAGSATAMLSPVIEIRLSVAVLSAVAEPAEAIADKGEAVKAIAVPSAVSLPNILVASAGSATAMLSPEHGIRLCVAAIVKVTCSVAVLSAVAEPVEAIADKGEADEAIAELREAARLFDNSFNNSVSPLINASFFFLFQP